MKVDPMCGVLLGMAGKVYDSLTRDGRFIVFADSIPPVPTVYAVASTGNPVTIYWSGKDAKDGAKTEYKIIAKDGSNPDENSDIVVDFRSGDTFASGSLESYDYSYAFTPTSHSPKHTYYYQVIARVARLATMESLCPQGLELLSKRYIHRYYCQQLIEAAVAEISSLNRDFHFVATGEPGNRRKTGGATACGGPGHYRREDPSQALRSSKKHPMKTSFISKVGIE